MKKILFTLALLILGMSASAQEFTVDGIRYEVVGAVGVPMWQLIVSPADVMPVAGVTISCPHCGKPLKITGV